MCFALEVVGSGTRLQRATIHAGDTQAALDGGDCYVGEASDAVQRERAAPVDEDGHRDGQEEFQDDLIDEGEDEADLESEAQRVETGDTYVVYTDRPEHGDRFFLVLCDMPVHGNAATFTDGWGCTWMKDTMLISGTYYRRLPRVGRASGSYRYELLEDEPKAWNYSHLVVQSKVDLVQYKSNKRNPRFKMTAETREEILSNVEERQAYNAH